MWRLFWGFFFFWRLVKFRLDVAHLTLVLTNQTFFSAFWNSEIWLQVLWKRWRHHRCDNFEDKGVALSGLIRKLSTKAQLGSFILTLPFEVAKSRLEAPPSNCGNIQTGPSAFIYPPPTASTSSTAARARQGANVYLCRGNDDKVWDRGDADSVTTASLRPPLTPTAERVNNKIFCWWMEGKCN